MSPYRVFLTGKPGCGKTTAIRRLCEILGSRGIRVGGMISEELRNANGGRSGFKLENLRTHESGVLAHVDHKDGPRVGKYRVNLMDIQRVAVKAIQQAISEADVILIDELGPMELHSESFIQAVQAALAAPKPLAGTIHRSARHHLVTSIRSNPDYDVIEITDRNRDVLPEMIAKRLTM